MTPEVDRRPRRPRSARAADARRADRRGDGAGRPRWARPPDQPRARADQVRRRVRFETITRYELGVLPLFLLMAHLCFAGGRQPRFLRRRGTHRRASPRRARARVDRRLRRLRRHQRLEPRDGGDGRLGRAAGDAQARLLDGLATGALAAGGTLGSLIPPSGRADRVRHHRRAVDRQAVHRGDHSRAHPGALLHGDDRAAVPVRPALGPAIGAGAVARASAALLRIADIGLLIVLRDRRPRARLVHADRGGVGRLRRRACCCAPGGATEPRQRSRDALRTTLRTTGMIYVVIIGALMFAVFISVTRARRADLRMLVREPGCRPARRDRRHGAGAAAARLGARRPGADAARRRRSCCRSSIDLGLSARSGSASSWCARWRSASCIRRSASTSTCIQGIAQGHAARHHLQGRRAVPGRRLPAPGAADRGAGDYALAAQRTGAMSYVRTTSPCSACCWPPTLCGRAREPRRANVLTYASPYPPTHPFSRADMRWMKFVEGASAVVCGVRPFWGGSLLSSDKASSRSPRRRRYRPDHPDIHARRLHASGRQGRLL